MVDKGAMKPRCIREGATMSGQRISVRSVVSAAMLDVVLKHVTLIIPWRRRRLINIRTFLPKLLDQGWQNLSLPGTIITSEFS